MHLVTDGGAVPLAAIVTAGQVHESTQFEPVMERVRPPRAAGWPAQVAGDKGYSYPRVRRWLARRRIEAVIPQRRDQMEHDGPRPLNRRVYRRRSGVERAVGWLKECRRLGTRFEKLATTFLAMVHLGIIQRYLRLLTP